MQRDAIGFLSATSSDFPFFKYEYLNRMRNNTNITKVRNGIKKKSYTNVKLNKYF